MNSSSNVASIFREYFTEQPFVDRFVLDPADAVDVIIPVYHTNELWRANLTSIYREVPVRRMLISDGGCIDNSIEIVSSYPRVEVLDHRDYKSLGKCIAELIKVVSTEWFIYLHSDVYLPPGWFDAMKSHQGEFDWFGCPMNTTVMVNYRAATTQRPYAGSQMGRKEAFLPRIDIVDDDFVYRQEDFVFKKIVEDNGYREGKIEDTFHYHQVMFRPSHGFDLRVKSVLIETHESDQERRRGVTTQLFGIIKYLAPGDPWVTYNFTSHAFLALESGYLTFEALHSFIMAHNPAWSPYFTAGMVRRRNIRLRVGAFARRVAIVARAMLRRSSQ